MELDVLFVIEVGQGVSTSFLLFLEGQGANGLFDLGREISKAVFIFLHEVKPVALLFNVMSPVWPSPHPQLGAVLNINKEIVFRDDG